MAAIPNTAPASVPKPAQSERSGEEKNDGRARLATTHGDTDVEEDEEEEEVVDFEDDAGADEEEYEEYEEDEEDEYSEDHGEHKVDHGHDRGQGQAVGDCRMEDIYPIEVEEEAAGAGEEEEEEEEEDGVRVHKVDRSAERRRRLSSNSSGHDMLGDKMVYSEVNPLSAQGAEKYGICLRDPAQLGYMPAQQHQHLPQQPQRYVQQQQPRLTAYLPASVATELLPYTAPAPAPAPGPADGYSTYGGYAQYNGYVGAMGGASSGTYLYAPAGPVVTAPMPESYLQQYNPYAVQTAPQDPAPYMQQPSSSYTSGVDYGQPNPHGFAPAQIGMPMQMPMQIPMSMQMPSYDPAVSVVPGFESMMLPPGHAAIGVRSMPGAPYYGPTAIPYGGAAQQGSSSYRINLPAGRLY